MPYSLRSARMHARGCASPNHYVTNQSDSPNVNGRNAFEPFDTSADWLRSTDVSPVMTSLPKPISKSDEASLGSVANVLDILGCMKAGAAIEVVDSMRVLTKSGSNLVAEVLGGREFIEWDHYPPDDVLDPESHAQYYFHAHPPGDSREPDYGHFHTFLRGQGIPEGVAPAPVPPNTAKASPGEPICHLIGISMTQEGLPDRLFTTNRWVAGDTWYAASDVIRMLDRFVIDLSRPSWPLNRWLTAMFVLFRPQIEQLLHERDARITAWRAAHPEQEVYEDRRLEITSALKISIEQKIRSMDWFEDVVRRREFSAGLASASSCPREP